VWDAEQAEKRRKKEELEAERRAIAGKGPALIVGSHETYLQEQGD